MWWNHNIGINFIIALIEWQTQLQTGPSIATSGNTHLPLQFSEPLGDEWVSVFKDKVRKTSNFAVIKTAPWHHTLRSLLNNGPAISVYDNIDHTVDLFKLANCEQSPPCCLLVSLFGVKLVRGRGVKGSKIGERETNKSKWSMRGRKQENWVHKVYFHDIDRETERVSGDFTPHIHRRVRPNKEIWLLSQWLQLQLLQTLVNCEDPYCVSTLECINYTSRMIDPVRNKQDSGPCSNTSNSVV